MQLLTPTTRPVLGPIDRRLKSRSEARIFTGQVTGDGGTQIPIFDRGSETEERQRSVLGVKPTDSVSLLQGK